MFQSPIRENLTPRITARVIFTRSQWCQIIPSARILASTARKSAHIRLRASVKALDRRPCFQCEAAMRALPSAVLGPVDLPPCSEHRPLRLYAGLWQGVPLRVLAPHRWPGQSMPKRHGMPFSRLLFVMLKSPPHLGFYYTPYFVALRGLCGLVRVPWSASNLLTQIGSMHN